MEERRVPGAGKRTSRRRRVLSVCIAAVLAGAALASGTSLAPAKAETPQTSPGVPTGWGNNGLGALGAPISDGPTPVTVPDEQGTTQVSMGCSHALYLHSDGPVWASGRNNFR